MDIADKIKFLRKHVVQLSQENFAAQIDVTRTTIKNWENGTSKPTVSHILLISLLCNVSTDYLIFDDCPYQLSLHNLNDQKYIIIFDLISFFLSKNATEQEES